MASVVTPDGGAVTATDEDVTTGLIYQLTGLYPASEFFSVNSETAEIRLIQDLRVDVMRASRYLLVISAHDTAYPDNVGSATVLVDVERNPNAPVFNASEYALTVDEKLGLGEEVITVAATDADQVSKR